MAVNLHRKQPGSTANNAGEVTNHRLRARLSKYNTLPSRDCEGALLPRAAKLEASMYAHEESYRKEFPFAEYACRILNFACIAFLNYESKC